MADGNKREFTEEQLRASEGHVGLQAGYNKGASQAGVGSFGNTRHMWTQHVAKIALVVQIWLIFRIDDDSISNQFLQLINLSLSVSLSRSLAPSLFLLLLYNLCWKMKVTDLLDLIKAV